jgi:hypothetical protein
VLGEFAYWKSLFLGTFRSRIPVIPYVPQRRQLPPRVLDVNSAWKGIESILPDLKERFHIGNSSCLEFGVEHGYSTAAFSCCFDKVTGVDTFTGDKNTRDNRDIYAMTCSRLEKFENIRLVRSDYRDWIASDETFYDLIHVDIVHSYIDTYTCGLWSTRHSTCTLFHDTESFPAVKRAIIDISRLTGKKFYNFQECNGLGILA